MPFRKRPMCEYDIIFIYIRFYFKAVEILSEN